MGTRLSDLLPGLANMNRSMVNGAVGRRSAKSRSGTGGSTRRRSLSEVADLVHLSPGRAQRVFSHFVGESPGRYQQRVALDRAAATLASSDRPVADVAFDHGFGSHEGFTRAFNARFGVSPREYRNRAVAPWTGTQLDLAAKASPCVALYHAPLASKPNQRDQERAVEENQSQSVSVEELSPTPMLCMERRIDRDEFAAVLAELLPAVFQHVMEQGLPMAGPPFVRYLEQSAAFLTVQAGIPLAEQPKPPAPELNIDVGELPGGSVATTIHRGSYDTLGDSHMMLDRWMAANGRKPAGAPWEVYLTDPGEVPDPKDWETQILWPVEPTG